MAISVTFRFEEAQCFADITQDSATPTTVFIGKYSKVITEREQTINLTPYLREQIRIQAVTHETFSTVNMSVVPAVTINGKTYTATASYRLASVAFNPDDNLCSDLPYRVIDSGQTDVVYIQLNKGWSGEVRQGATLLTYNDHRYEYNDIVPFAIQPTADIKVTISDDKGVPYDNIDIRYRIRPMGLNGVRLAWLNRYGALDFWNFDHLREQEFAATSETIYTHNGYTKLNTAAERRYTVETRELTTEALNTMSYIIASPAVWVVTDDGAGNTTFEEVDVVTEECKVFNDAELLGLQVSYRPKKRVL